MMNSRFVENALFVQTAGYAPPKTLWRIETALQAQFSMICQANHPPSTANH